MMKIVELPSDRKLQLPEEFVERFQPADRFLVWAKGDTIFLKRISVPPLTDIVEKTPLATEPPSMDEIVEIVHEVRRKRSVGAEQ